jgi:RNA polymerase sigma-70 factor (sigma-E family)
MEGDFQAYVASRGAGWERYAYALTGDAYRAQDLVQTVLLQAYRRWPRIVTLEHPDAYIRRMVTNSYLGWRRQKRNWEIPTGDLPERENSPDPAIGVVDRVELRRALQELSPHQRAVLVLRHVEGLDDEQIGQMLGCSVGTVRGHASRGRQRIVGLITATSISPAAEGTR